MKLSRRTLSLALLAALAAPAAHAEIALDVIADSEVSFEGLFQADAYWYDNDIMNLDADGADGLEHDFEMRRSEVILKGKGPGNIEWVMGYEAKGDKWLDVNAKYKFGNNANHFIQIGQFKQPNSLEELGSTRFNDFIAKANVTNTFGLARRLGAQYRYGDVNWAITGSVFTRELTEHPAPTPHGPGYGVRAYWAPVNSAGSILHLALSHIDYDTFQDSARWRSRPNADLSQRIIDTGSSGIRNADRVATTGFESFWVTGPFKLQAEYMQSTTDRYATGFSAQPGDDFKGSAGYISAVWNVTGETWTYKDGTSVTSLPSNPGLGMWQLTARYDTMDLNDGYVDAAGKAVGVLGGEMDTWTVGVNWYWRSNFKFMLNYVAVDSSKYIGKTSSTYSLDPAFNNRTFNGIVDDNPNILEARMQFYW
ncbi:porin [Lysobacter sp. CFH 32150]|uniref:OprO/OprP family phosphate-selective porin n=1 Tax=Lysobacter sp. CFH 32150 TaxID=2927128 RepID=UPI001FA7690F|nr:porin [Lysobacter sp. CFH 32150]MCI4566791.1 OprO/OprP family phosphate-selective porin [Lysobacter sp. CFH 32150]